MATRCAHGRRHASARAPHRDLYDTLRAADGLAVGFADEEASAEPGHKGAGVGEVALWAATATAVARPASGVIGHGVDRGDRVVAVGVSKDQCCMLDGAYTITGLIVLHRKRPGWPLLKGESPACTTSPSPHDHPRPNATATCVVTAFCNTFSLGADHGCGGCRSAAVTATTALAPPTTANDLGGSLGRVSGQGAVGYWASWRTEPSTDAPLVMWSGRSGRRVGNPVHAMRRSRGPLLSSSPPARRCT
ncbi:hypothetical protein SUDANB13_01025 [Streptomyces sp. enrichment culture]